MAECVRAQFDLGESERRKITKKQYAACVISLIIGAAGLLVYMALVVALSLQEQYYEELPKELDWFLLFALPFACGLVFTITLKNQYKQAAANGGRLVYEFYSNCFIIGQFKGNIKIGSARYGYEHIIKSKAVKGYLKFYLIRTAAYYIDISALNEREVSTIKRLLKLPYSGEVAEVGAADQCNDFM